MGLFKYVIGNKLAPNMNQDTDITGLTKLTPILKSNSNLPQGMTGSDSDSTNIISCTISDLKLWFFI